MVSTLYVYILILSVLSGAVADTLEVKCSNFTSTAGSTAMLNCSIKCLNSSPVTLRNDVWFRNSSHLCSSKDVNPAHQGRFTCSHQQNSNTSLNLSFQINNITKEDEGKYTFTVHTNCGYKKDEHARLFVTALGEKKGTGTTDREPTPTQTPQQQSNYIVPILAVPAILVILAVILAVWKKQRSYYHQSTSVMESMEDV